jgi:hypothetical protein
VEIYCKRTFFDLKDKEVLCKKGKIYQTFPPSEFESESGVCFWISTEIEEKIPLTLKTFKKYFLSIDEMRDNKINEILK